jgi:hypothetical protein
LVEAPLTLFVRPSGGDALLDVVQVVTVAILVATGIASALIFWRAISSIISSPTQNTKSGEPSLIIPAITTVLFMPIILFCSIGSLWLVMVGWEGLENTLIISIEGGLVMGVFMAVFVYVVSVVGRRQQRKIEEDMKKIEKTKRPLPAKYGKKVALAIPALILVTFLFNFLMSNFTIDMALWERVFPYEAIYWCILGLVPFIPNSRFQFSIHDAGAQWWLITLLTVAAILAVLSVLTYFF